MSMTRRRDFKRLDHLFGQRRLFAGGFGIFEHGFVLEWAQAAQGRLFGQVRGHSDLATLALVGDLRGFRTGGLGRHQVHPPLHHAVALGKEAVPADVHAVALVPDGAGDAADLVRGLNDDGLDVRAAKQLKRRGQPRRARPYDDCFLPQLSPRMSPIAHNL
jgi:hypothetical protein